MKLLLDTANLADIKYFNEYYPIVGVTTNPTILSREGGDIVAHLKEIRNIIGDEKELHVQVTERTYEGIIEEAKAIVYLLGNNTYVKIPATDVGIKATQYLTSKGFSVTMTAILSPSQAMLASNAGAAYVAPYVSRLENICDDGIEIVAEIQKMFNVCGTETQIIAASFKTVRQVLNVALAGAGAATVGVEVMTNLLNHTSTDTSIAGFYSDWKKVFGDVTLGELIAKSK